MHKRIVKDTFFLNKSMKRTLFWITLILTLIFTTPAVADNPADEPFKIYTEDDLMEFSRRISTAAEYPQGGSTSAVLMADLDMRGYDWKTMDGTQWVGDKLVHGYYGTFDGNNHTISNISAEGGGFFHLLGEGGVIRNLTLENMTIERKKSFSIYWGGIVGRSYGTIENCHVSGTLEARDTMYVGGIVGALEEGVILDCTSDLDIHLVITETGVESFGYFELGGIAAQNGGLIDGCVNYGDLSSEGLNCGCGSNVGGVVGFSGYRSELRNCGNMGDISVDSRVLKDKSSNNVCIGGIVGDHFSVNNVFNCYNMGDVTGKVTGEEAYGGGIDNEYIPGYRYKVKFKNCWSSGAVDVSSDINGKRTAEYFRVDDKYMLYYLNEAAAAGAYAGEYFSGEDMTNGKLVEELNRNLATMSNSTLRLWEQGEHGPVISDKYYSVQFSDLKPGAFYNQAVTWAVDKGITNGMGNGRFDPDGSCTRGQIVTFLWRAAGEPEPSTYSNPFEDVASSKYYHKAVLWAAEQGITLGVSDGEFAPDQACTRGQVVTFLWRFNHQPEAGGTNPFGDVSHTAFYYHPVLWAIEHEITNGLSADRFGPDETCTRGQIVTFLYRSFR